MTKALCDKLIALSKVFRKHGGIFVMVMFAAFIPTPLVSQFIRPSIPAFNACDFCLAAQGISPLEVGSSGARIDFRYLSVGTMYQDGSRIANADHELETHLTQQYSLFYTLSSTFSLSAIVPVVRRHSEQLSDRGELILGNQFGLGDIVLLARYKPLVVHSYESTYIVSLQGGAKAPTGRTDGKDTQGNLLDAHVQPGTGSTDFLVGGSGFAASGRFAFIGNVLGSITSDGANGHRFGNSLNYDLTVRYRPGPEEYDAPQFFLALSLNGEVRGHEIQDGIPDPNSGGHVIYASPGIQVLMSSRVTLEMSYQTAILHSLHGLQLGEDYRLLSGLQFLF